MDSLLLMLLLRMLLTHSVEQYWLRVRHVLVRLNMVCLPFMQWVLITVLYRLMVQNSLSSMALQRCMLIKSMRLVSLTRMLQRITISFARRLRLRMRMALSLLFSLTSSSLSLRCVTLTLSLLAVNLLHWMISILMQPRLLQHVHSFLYVTLCHSCRLT